MRNIITVISLADMRFFFSFFLQLALNTDMETLSKVFKYPKEKWVRFRVYILNWYTFVDAFNYCGIPATTSYVAKKRIPVSFWLSTIFVKIPIVIKSAVAFVNIAKYNDDDIRFYFHDFSRACGDAGPMLVLLLLVYSIRNLSLAIAWFYILRNEKSYNIIKRVLCQQFDLTGERLANLKKQMKYGGPIIMVMVFNAVFICFLPCGVAYFIVEGERVQNLYSVIIVGHQSKYLSHNCSNTGVFEYKFAVFLYVYMFSISTCG
jgi:hypothetical protein